MALIPSTICSCQVPHSSDGLSALAPVKHLWVMGFRAVEFCIPPFKEPCQLGHNTWDSRCACVKMHSRLQALIQQADKGRQRSCMCHTQQQSHIRETLVQRQSWVIGWKTFLQPRILLSSRHLLHAS